MRGNVVVLKIISNCIYKLALVIFFSVYSSYGQLSPPLVNFAPNDYKGVNQIWDIAQNDDGDLFFANHDQMLKYDGSQWTVLRIDKPTIFRALHHYGNQMLSGGLMDFGIWTKNELGLFEYRSLVEKLNLNPIEGESFWNITSYKEYVIFQSLDRVIITDQEFNDYEQIDGVFSNNSLINMNGAPFLIDLKKGLLDLSGNRKSYQQFNNVSWASIIGAIDIDNRSYLVSNKGLLYHWTEQELQLEELLRIPQDRIYSICQMESGILVLGTVGHGVVWFNESLAPIDSLKRDNGLINNTVLSLFEDRDSNLWAGMDRGISLVNITSPHREHRNSSKDIGSVYTAVEWNHTSYIGTNQGLYVLNSEITVPMKIAGIEGQVWKLDVVDDRLLCSSDSGLFQIISPESIKIISDDVGFWGVQKQGAHLIGGTYKGLYVFDDQKGYPILGKQLDGFTVSSRFVEIVGSKVYVNNEYLGVYVLELDEKFESIIKQSFVEKKGSKSSLFKYNNRLFYKCTNGIYTFDADNQNLNKDPDFTKLLAPDLLLSSGFTSGPSHPLIAFRKNSVFGIQKNLISDRITPFEYELPPYVYENLGNSGFENISHLSDERYLIGLSDGFVIIDLEELSQKSDKKPSFSLVEQLVTNRWVPKEINRESLELNYRNNSMRFFLRIPSYTKYTPLSYEIRLLHNGKLHSKKAMTSKVEYINLEPGAYIVQISRPGKGEQSIQVDASYSFIIKAPWFLQKPIQVLLLLLLLLILFMAFYFTRIIYKKREKALRLSNQKQVDILQLKEKERINKITQRTLENQLKAKKRELTISTEHLLSKNRLLRQLSLKISEVEKLHQLDLTNLHQFIEENIKEKKDWNRFEKALADYDEEFVKRIKNQFYGTISRQDFLLMTYIRGGMNSKDIAQVLGISVKSVEMRRYRLRKKLGLKEEVSLNDYINNL